MIRVFVVEDHPLMRRSVRNALQACLDITVVGEAEDAETAIPQIDRLQPQVAVVDLSLPGRSGIDLARDLQASSTRVLAYSAFSTPSFVRGARNAGASGYLTKEQPETRLVCAVRAIARGETFWPSRLDAAADPAAGLTPRQHECLMLLADGRTHDDIARDLRVAPGTIRNTLTEVYAAIGVSRAAQAVAWAWKRGLGRS